MSFSLLLFLIISSSLATVTVQDAALIDKICKKTDAYNLCVDALLSDARSPTADLNGLALVSINLMLKNITDNSRVINELLDKAQDPSMKEALGTCQVFYGEEDAMHDIQVAFQAQHSKNYADMVDAAGGIASDAQDCDDTFRQMGIHPNPLGLRNKNLLYLSEITMAIGNMLA